ncbi:MAG: ACP S-malonyltransferase [Pyrinomonadaceae bacterium]|nr:ACP S-malonyltransferase [Pyrinomonadaceae bacterium]
MGKIAYIFPGQGSQSVGMGKDLFDSYAEARSVFEEADESLGFSLSEMCFSGTEEDLALTANTQPAILTTSIAAYRAMEANGYPKPDYVAGHSLGEYSALVAAGAINLADAVKTVRKRGAYMQDAVAVGVGAMAAIIGSDLSTVQECCQEAAQQQICSPANINSAKQIVIAGNAEAIDRACEILKDRGARRAIKLNVSAPFHCALMKAAEEKLSIDLQGITFSDLDFPIFENVSAEENSKGARVAEALTRQVSSPVRWLETVQNIIGRDVDTFVEVGAGKVLSGLVRQIDRNPNCFNVEDSESLSNTLSNL